jgi:uncharacterized membrane protein YgcG
VTSQEQKTSQYIERDIPDTEVIIVSAASPVFVDATGRRRRLLRRVAYAFGGLCMLYGGLISVSLAGGPVSSSAILPLPDLGGNDKTEAAVRPTPPPAPPPTPSATTPRARPILESLPQRPVTRDARPAARQTTPAPPKTTPTPKPSASPSASATRPTESTTTPPTAAPSTTPSTGDSSVPPVPPPTRTAQVPPTVEPTSGTGGAGAGSGSGSGTGSGGSGGGSEVSGPDGSGGSSTAAPPVPPAVETDPGDSPAATPLLAAATAAAEPVPEVSVSDEEAA